MTQKELSELSGVNEVQLRRYELGGKNSNPKIETLQKIANALDVSIDVLLSRRIVLSREESQISQIEIEQERNELDFLNKVDQFQQLLNDIGKNKALEQIELITKIPEYQKNPATPSSAYDLPATHKSESTDPDPEALQHESDE